MTEPKQPEAMRSLYDITGNIADVNTLLINSCDLRDLRAKNKVLSAENESLRAERERNLHSIRVNNEIINKNIDENETLRTGYAAARLEIESLRARGAAPAGKYPEPPMSTAMHAIDGVTACWPSDQMRAYGEACWKAGYKHGAWADAKPAVPDVSGYVSEWSGGLCTSDEAMDGIAKLYAAQPAGAQQPGADPELLKFYGVTTDAELIAAQAAHIKKLQTKLPKTPSFAPQRVREG